MKEMGGYIEFERYSGGEYHENCIALNSGRNCLRYLLRAKKIKKLALPKWICSAVIDACQMEKTEIYFYDVDRNFKPMLETVPKESHIYIVNYYGQLKYDYMCSLYEKYPHIIIDNAHAFFDRALPGVDTIYTCRKFFGVCDGAYLYTDCRLDAPMERERAYDKMGFLLGRFECGAGAFYDAYQKNEQFIADQDIKYMSHLTQNILKSLDYEEVKNTRSRNFQLLSEGLGRKNLLRLFMTEGAYMYPLLVPDGKTMRKKLIEKKIYVPLLWPNVIKGMEESESAYYLADHILPLPCDQRYTEEDMQYLIEVVNELTESGGV